jgi:two-component system response regulator DegU
MADDHTLFRKAIIDLISSFACIQLVKGAANGKELLGLVKESPPDVAVVDLQMPVMNGAETCEALRRQFPQVKLIVLTMLDSERTVLQMMEMGVHAFLLKDCEPTELERALQAVVEKDFYHNDLVANALRKRLLDRGSTRSELKSQNLTEREKQIVLLVCEELTNKEISSRLEISDNTARNHRVHIMEKLGVKNIAGLVRYAYETGLIR